MQSQPHCTLPYLDKRNTYARMLFIDYSSAFNTIVPCKLVIKLETLGLDPALCNWVLDFLTGRPQVVRVGNISQSSTMTVLQSKWFWVYQLTTHGNLFKCVITSGLVFFF